MRLLIASMAALAAVAFAAPSFAQDQDPASAPAPVPTAKPKAGTAAYCQSLKTSSSRSSCLKKLSAKSPPKAPTTASAKKTKKTKTAPASIEPKQPDVGQLTAPAAPTPTAAAPAGAVAVPPLPQKTI